MKEKNVDIDLIFKLARHPITRHIRLRSRWSLRHICQRSPFGHIIPLANIVYAETLADIFLITTIHMKKILIPLSIALALILLFLTFSFYNFHNYPNAIIATSDNPSEKNQFYLNNKLVGDNRGFCVVIRDEEYTEIKLTNDTKKEVAILSNKFRFSIAEPTGDKLGLKIIRANANQDLRKEFGCEI